MDRYVGVFLVGEFSSGDLFGRVGYQIRSISFARRRGRGELSVDGGCISEISVGPLPKGEREIDAGDKTVIPGVVDARAQIHDPKHPLAKVS